MVKIEFINCRQPIEIDAETVAEAVQYAVENGCFFKTREEADRIADGIERETKGTLFIDRRGGANGRKEAAS